MKKERSLEEEIELYQRLTREHPHAAERILRHMAEVGKVTELSPMELRVLLFISHGLTIQMIADMEHKSYHTIWSLARQGRVKLGAKNKAHAVALALRRGIIK